MPYFHHWNKAAGERELLLVARLGTLGVAALIAFVALCVAGVGGDDEVGGVAVLGI